MPGSRPVDLCPFLLLLHDFHAVFTQPPFRTFVELVAGWACPAADASSPSTLLRRPRRPRTRVSLPSLLQPRRLVPRRPRHGPGTALVAPFAPTGPILLGRDDTLCRKRGLTLFGAGMHHDPLMSSKALKVFRGGHDWVVLFLLRPGPACLRTASNGSVYRIQPIACRAVERTARLALVLYPRIVVWFDHEGHRCVRFPERPWRRHEPSPRLRTCGRASVAGSGRRIEPTSARKAVSRESSWSSCWKWPAAPAETAAPRRQQ